MTRSADDSDIELDSAQVMRLRSWSDAAKATALSIAVTGSQNVPGWHDMQAGQSPGSHSGHRERNYQLIVFCCSMHNLSLVDWKKTAQECIYTLCTRVHIWRDWWPRCKEDRRSECAHGVDEYMVHWNQERTVRLSHFGPWRQAMWMDGSVHPDCVFGHDHPELVDLKTLDAERQVEWM